jgi:hypothetical protein
MAGYTDIYTDIYTADVPPPPPPSPPATAPPPASILSAILAVNPAHPYDGTDPRQRRIATFSYDSPPSLPSLMTDVVFMPQYGLLDANIQATGYLSTQYGLQVTEGDNARQGTVTLSSGSAVVANTSVTATSRIFLTSQADGGTPGWLRVSARTAGVSFTITSSSGTDASTVAFEIFEPG